jgi:gamma-glutamyltranspeptidase/glutathione hydrolase
LAAIVGIGLAVSACGSSKPPEGQVGHLIRDFGGVVSDEPRSALIGRDILSAGGNAADAAVAMYFTLAVTYPHAATIGGGGVCVVHRREKDRSEVSAIDFRPGIIERGGKAVAVPGAVRGFAALHARYGKFKWEELLLPAERMARFGNPVSRAFARELTAIPADVFSDPGMRELFTRDGTPLKEGEILREVRLSSTLGRIRLRGGGDFYTGDFSRTLADGLAAMSGVDVAPADVRDYLPRWIDTATARVGLHVLHVPAGPEGIAAIAAWEKAASGSAAARVPQGAPAYPDSAGFAAVDLSGNGVACVVGANGPFGAARLIGTTGIVAAAPVAGAAVPGLPALLVNRARRDVVGALTGSGRSSLRVERAVAAGFQAFSRRVELIQALAPGDSEARANAIFCPLGAFDEPDECRMAADPAGSGLAAGAAK